MADEENEIVAAAKRAKAAADNAADAKRAARQRRWQIGKLGLGVGIGSAAVAAAVLFANRETD